MKLTVHVTWVSTHEIEVPDYDNFRKPDTLDELMILVKSDPNGPGDIDSGGATVSDWDVISWRS